MPPVAAVSLLRRTKARYPLASGGMIFLHDAPGIAGYLAQVELDTVVVGNNGRGKYTGTRFRKVAAWLTDI
jgi:hypothetical protein